MRSSQAVVALSLGMILGTPLASGATPQTSEAPAAPMAVAMPPSDLFSDFIESAQRLTAADRHQEALRAWQSAYALRQRPGLLLEIGRTQQRLGLAAEAATSYRRFLTADPDPPAALKAEAEQAIARLDRLARPALLPSGPDGNPFMPFKVEKRRYHSGMRTGGITLFAIGYAAAFISGLVMGPIFLHSNSGSDHAVGVGSFCLLIPVAGPFVSGIVTPTIASGSGGYNYGSSLGIAWSLPWLLTSGAMQVTGVGLWAGAYRHPQNVIVPNAPDASWRFGTTPGDGNGMAATLTF